MAIERERERERLAQRRDYIRADRERHGDQSAFSRDELISAINAANADDDEMQRRLDLREQNREWARLRARLRELRPNDQTCYGSLDDLRAAVASAASERTEG